MVIPIGFGLVAAGCTGTSAAVPSDAAPILTIARSLDRWAVQPIRGEGWNVPIEGSALIRPALFRPWSASP